MNTEKPLDPCPFCKSAAVWHFPNQGSTRRTAQCQGCGANAPLEIWQRLGVPVEPVAAPVGLEADALALAKLIYIGMDSGAEWKKEAHRRAVALSNLIENSRSRAPVESVPAPAGLEALDHLEKMMDRSACKGPGALWPVGAMREKINAARAALSPRPATGATPDEKGKT